MGYVYVTYYRRRTVLIDGEPGGMTNTSLPVEVGTHQFELGGDKNYEPPVIETVVADASQILPQVIEFSPVRSEDT